MARAIYQQLFFPNSASSSSQCAGHTKFVAHSAREQWGWSKEAWCERARWDSITTNMPGLYPFFGELCVRVITWHARDIFKFIMSQLLLTRTIFHYSFFFGKSFRQFYITLFAAFPFNLLALNLEFEPNTRRELFLRRLERVFSCARE